MKKCTECNWLTRDDENFCSKCGTDNKETKSDVCECGTRSYDTEKFCPNCGEQKISNHEAIKSIWGQLRTQLDRVFR